MTFNYKFLCFTCSCGQENLEVKVASTSDFFLLFEWVCPNCGKSIQARISFEDLIKGVPPPPEPPKDILKDDISFLKELHIIL